MIPRIFVKDELILGNEILLKDKQFHYLNNVLKIKVGEQVFFINGRDGEFLGEIIKLQNKQLVAKIIKKTRPYKKEKFLGLIFAPIQKIDILIKSAVELGVSDFYPIRTQYTTHPKLDRAEGNIIEAVEQCERLDLPTLHKMNSLENTLNEIKDGVILFCEERANITMEKTKEHILNIKEQNVYCLVGCEGGWSEHEKILIRSYKNVIPVSLGELILRSETATSCMLSMVKFLKE